MSEPVRSRGFFKPNLGNSLPLFFQIFHVTLSFPSPPGTAITRILDCLVLSPSGLQDLLTDFVISVLHIELFLSSH